MSVLPNFTDDRGRNSHREESGTTAPLTPQQLEQLTTDGIDIPSLAELRAAVHHSGHRVADVERYLRERKATPAS